MDRTDARVNMINDRYTTQKHKIHHHLEHSNIMGVCDLLLKYSS